MKITVLLWLVMVVPAMPAHAGEVIIRETETAIIVEYTGTPDNRPVAGQREQPAAAGAGKVPGEPARSMSRREQREENRRKSAEAHKPAESGERQASPEAAE